MFDPLSWTPVERVAVLGVICLVLAQLSNPARESKFGKSAQKTASSENNRSRPRERMGRGLLFFGIGLLLGAMTLGRILASLPMRALTDPDLIALTLERRIAAWSTVPTNILLIDGGSYSARGIHSQLLTERLSEAGYSVAVLQYTLPGGNHFERHRIRQKIAAALKKKVDPRKTGVILLQETSAWYDYFPAAQVDSINDRTAEYLTPSVFAKILVSWFQSGLDLNAANLQTIGVMSAAAAYRFLNINRIHRLYADDVIDRAVDGYIAGPKPAEAKPVPTERVLQMASLADSELLQDTAMPHKSLWRIEMEIEEESTAYLGMLDKPLLVAPPHTDTEIHKYFLIRCKAGAHPCPGYRKTGELYRSVADPKYWNDLGHLSPAGAEIYTRFLAENLIEERFLDGPR